MRNKNGIALIILLYLFVVAGCNNESTGTKASAVILKTADSTAAGNENFDNILNCYDYTCADDYYFTADYGCIYNPKGPNIFGNLSVYLVPHKNSNNSNCDSIANNLMNRSIAQIKRDFDIYVYVIPKVYLHYNPTGDPVYYQKEDYTEKLYSFNSTIKSWTLIDSMDINRDTESSKAQKWREAYIQSKTIR